MADKALPDGLMADAIRAFVTECEVAGMTVYRSWVLPDDTQKLDEIADRYSNIVKMLVNSRMNIKVGDACKPLIWHIFREAVSFLKSTE